MDSRTAPAAPAAPAGPGPVPLSALLREDWETHERDLSSPGLHALAVHRAQVALRGRPGLGAKVARRVLRILNAYVVRNLYTVEIYPTTVVGRRVRIGHHMGVVLGRRSVVGDDCVIRQHVTLGRSGEGSGQPVIGRGVSLGAGSTVLGDVTVGDGARIGAHSLVLRDVPPGATVMTPPGRLLPVAPPPDPTEPPSRA